MSLIIWTLFALLFPFCVTATTLNMDPFACHIVDSQNVNQCSGTFIRSDIFVTAVLCLRNQYFGVLRDDLQPGWRIVCPNGHEVGVRIAFPNPRAYTSEFINSNVVQAKVFNLNMYMSEPNPDNRWDVAVLVTDPMETNLPKVAGPELTKKLLSLNNCHLLGYAPSRCPVLSPACVRTYNVKSSNENFISSVQKASVLLDHGDSGSGLICLDENSQSFLVGVNRGGIDEMETVNLSFSVDFFQQFIESQRIPSPPVLQPALVDLLRANGSLKQAFSLAKLEPTIGCLTEAANCTVAMEQLTIAVTDGTTISSGLRAHGISNIFIVAPDFAALKGTKAIVNYAFGKSVPALILSTDATIRDLAELRYEL